MFTFTFCRVIKFRLITCNCPKSHKNLWSWFCSASISLSLWLTVEQGDKKLTEMSYGTVTWKILENCWVKSLCWGTLYVDLILLSAFSLPVFSMPPPSTHTYIDTPQICLRDYSSIVSELVGSGKPSAMWSLITLVHVNVNKKKINIFLTSRSVRYKSHLVGWAGGSKHLYSQQLGSIPDAQPKCSVVEFCVVIPGYYSLVSPWTTFLHTLCLHLQGL